MNLNLRIVLPLLMGVVVYYSACKKNENTATPTTPNTQTTTQASIEIGKNLAQSIVGTFGGASIKDGVNPSVSFSTSKLKVQSNN